MRDMRVWLLGMTVSLTAIASADFNTAAEAYRRQDYVSAFAQFEPLAAAGDPRAQTVIALMYKYGESVKPDYAVAFEWYKRSADQGYAPAQFNVGMMLAAGHGGAADREEALAWLRRAAENGYDRARGELSRLGQSAGRSTGEIREWSQAWDLRLPDSYRYGEEPVKKVAAGAYKVQLGAMRSRDAAESLWSAMIDQQPELLRPLTPRYVRSEGSQTIYRLQAGPFDTLADAKAFCAEVRSAAGCLALQN